MLSLAVVTTNRLLQAMSADTRLRIAPHLEHVALPLGTVICEPGGKLEHLYFPVDCTISLINLATDRASTEVSVVGNEGVLGVSLFMGGVSNPSKAVVQGAGSAYRLLASSMDSEFLRHSDFTGLMLRYTQALMTQIGQTAVCNRHHSVDQQLTRWLLHMLDRVPGNILHMTQGLIAKMLGVRREGVTEAAGKLQARGAIAYRRGRIDVLDRDLLEESCCECYGVVKREYDRLLKPNTAAAPRAQAHTAYPLYRDTRSPRAAPYQR